MYIINVLLRFMIKGKKKKCSKIRNTYGYWQYISTRMTIIANDVRFLDSFIFLLLNETPSCFALAWVDTCSCVRASMTTCVRKVRIRGMNHNECLLWSRKIKSLAFRSTPSMLEVSENFFSTLSHSNRKIIDNSSRVFHRI